jgi:hypothetical protein
MFSFTLLSVLAYTSAGVAVSPIDEEMLLSVHIQQNRISESCHEGLIIGWVIWVNPSQTRKTFKFSVRILIFQKLNSNSISTKRSIDSVIIQIPKNIFLCDKKLKKKSSKYAPHEIRNYIPLTGDRNRFYTRQVYHSSEIMEVCFRATFMLMTVCAVQKQEGQYILPLSRLIQAVCE